MPEKLTTSTIICYYCGSDNTSKFGFTKNKKQNYLCRSCHSCSSLTAENNGSEVKKRKKPKAKPLPSKGRLVLELQSIAQRLGRTPTLADIRKLFKTGRVHSSHTYYKVFGSFPEALKAARLKIPLDPDLEKEILLGELRTLHKKLKRPLIETDVAAARKKGKVSPLYQFERVFGSVAKALAAAGAGRKKYSREDLIKLLRRIDAAQDRPVTAADINKWYHSGRGPSHRSFQKEFGGIAKARLAAGVLNVYRREMGAVRQWQKYTMEELTLQLQALEKNLGRKPSHSDINRASSEGLCASAVTFLRVFGSIVQAYRKAGFENIKPRTYTDREILAALKKLAREKGGMPTYRELAAASKTGLCPATSTIFRRFGSLRELKKHFIHIGLIPRRSTTE